MDKFLLDRDIKVLYVTATSFPAGIADAHERLHKLVSSPAERRFFGISRPEKGHIVYKAGVEEKYGGEAKELACETMTIQKGTYVAIAVPDHTADPLAIGKAFQKLIAQPGIDPSGYCVECYLDAKMVRCMVRLEN